MGEFYSQRIKVRLDASSGLPVSFIWKETEHRIVELESAWQEFGFSPLAPKKRDWRQRRHRNWYRVKTQEGEIFELYLDRGTRLNSKKQWILYRKIN